MAVALVTSTTKGGATPQTSSAIDTTGASLLVLTMATSTGSITVTDSKGNTWNQVTPDQAGTGVTARMYYAWNPTVGTGHTFTVTGGGVPAFSIAAYSGVQTTSDPYEVGSGGIASSSTLAGVGSASITPSAAGALIVSNVGLAAAVTSLAGQAGFTTPAFINFVGGTNYGNAQSYLVQGAAATVSNATAIVTWTTASNIAIQSAMFKAGAGGGGGALAAGAASHVSATSATINLSAAAATGGTAPYTYQWYRSTTANFTPGAGNILSGATSLTLADSASLAADTPYYYVCRATDNVAATADSNQVAGVLKAAAIKFGFIGDSITFGYGLAGGLDPVTQIGPMLKKLYKNRDVTVTNSAVSGSRTAQWVTGQANLTTAKAAFAAASVTHVHVMLGANDAAAATLVSAATYKSNLQNIIADLNGAGYKVILSYPTYIPAGANSNATTAAGVALAQSYQAQIDSLIDYVNVIRGDTLAFNYFADNLGEYQSDMTHPTAAGAVALATMWARAIDRNVFGLDRPPATKTVTVTFESRTGALRASLTGLKWEWSDVFGTVIDSGTGATTNASGVFSISVRTYLAAAGIGYLKVTNSAGAINTTDFAFFGPVAVA